MDLYEIEKAAGLLPERNCFWVEDQVPLENRGVKLSWLLDFVRQVEKQIEDEWVHYNNSEKECFYFDLPEPAKPEFPRYQILNSYFLVPNLVKPLTEELKSPLFARVPLEQRGKPDVFISHAWSQALVTGNRGCTLEILTSPLKKANYPHDPYIWMDIVAYNQHGFESVASEMKTAIQSIGQLCLPLIDVSPFSRLWCLWEILCAHVAGSEIAIHEPSDSRSNIGFIFDIYLKDLRSVSDAYTKLPEDKEEILNAMISTFGSIHQTDEYLHELLENGLTHWENG